MQYLNLRDLVANSSSSRKFFLSQPVGIQLELSERGDYIRSAAELRRYSDLVRTYDRAVLLSGGKCAAKPEDVF